MACWLVVIGVGEEEGGGIDRAGWALIRDASLLVGGERHLALVPEHATSAERVVWGRPFEATLDLIVANRGRPVVVLASGDPMEWGIGATLARYVTAEEMTVLPHLGAFSLAAARLAWPLNTVRRITLHGRPLDQLALFLEPDARLLALSRDGATPGLVARWLEARGWGVSEIVVLERLGSAEERVVRFTAAGCPDERFADLNSLAITLRPEGAAKRLSRLAGLDDSCFENDGQLTKREIRAATLAKLAPGCGETLWDVGAGCGSIAIEWLRSGDAMHAIAIERSAARLSFITRNARSLGVPELEIIHGAAPLALESLTPPDAVFIGGGLTEETLSYCWRALRGGGRLVANAVSIEGERVLLAAFDRLGGDLTRLSLSHVSGLGEHHVWRPAMPVCQFSATKPR